LRAARDGDVIADARAAAETVLAADPALEAQEPLKQALRRRLSASEREYLNKG
jgi:ATP-dependent DNA helicase RecG